MVDKKIVTFGEIMLRLSSPDFQLVGQSDSYNAAYGGGEANVAVSLAIFGNRVSYVTCLPLNPVGEGAIRFLRQYGVDTSFIRREGRRIGIYFLEAGAAQRPSRVIYDRAHSAISEIGQGSIDWKAVFQDADWFHWTGITPAISRNAADVCMEAIKAARRSGITVSCDLNFRRKLWKYGKSAEEIMGPLVELADIAVGNEEDAEKVFGIKAPEADVEGGRVEAGNYKFVAAELAKRFPNLKKAAITLRGSISATHNTWSGILYDSVSKTMFTGHKYDITHIIDRVGSGDAFAAGLIHSLRNNRPDQEAVDFAAASSCLKHSIPGDCNLTTIEMVDALLKKGGSGRVER